MKETTKKPRTSAKKTATSKAVTKKTTAVKKEVRSVPKAAPKKVRLPYPTENHITSPGQFLASAEAYLAQSDVPAAERKRLTRLMQGAQRAAERAEAWRLNLIRQGR
tara:strand:- start:404 stop:724 length:321 start_codon:yes stop_codon:yes gene_type:complete